MRAIDGTIRRRLLVNATVDPDEAAERLPPGLRPLATDGRTVVGCCLLEIESIRPAGVPSVVGWRLRAAAHRISVEWDEGLGSVATGVYVPVRLTDSRLAVAVGGRSFPGVHDRARVEVSATDSTLRWSIEPLDPTGLGMRVCASFRSEAELGASCTPVGTTCLTAAVGVSPDRRGRLEAARMDLSHRNARQVAIEDLESGFLDSFSTAEPSSSYLMGDADVTWTPWAAPATIVEARV